MDAKKLLRKARKSISSFCIEECRAYCCRKGYLVLKEKEAEKLTGKRIKFLKKLENGSYSLHLSKQPCPMLTDFKCTIHESKLRPKACYDFPIFIHSNQIHFSQRCLAVRQGRFYPYIAKLKKMGCIVLETPEIAEIID